MNAQDEFSVIFNALKFIGFNVSKKKYNFKQTKIRKLKSLTIHFYEFFYVLFNVYMVFISMYSLSYDSPILKFTSASLHIILLFLRISLFSKRSRLSKILKKLRIFANLNQNDLPNSMAKKLAIFACGLCFVVPTVVSGAIIVIVLCYPDHHKDLNYFVRNETSSHFVYNIMFAVIQTAYTIVFLVFPGLVMTLLSFMYLSYINAIKRRFLSEKKKLLSNFSQQAVSECLNVLMTAKKIHSEMEEALSLIAFLTYVLTFGNILNIVCVFATNFMSSMKTIRSVYTINVFIWTVSWFVVMTICGSRATGLGNFLKDVAQDIVARSLRDLRRKSSKDLIHLQLFGAFSKLDLCFTAWGMFRVNKRLLLTTSGLLVTYSVLFASELRGGKNLEKI